jgi:hypothetical protein
MAVYNLTILIWFGYALIRCEPRKLAANPLQTQRWEDGLADVQQHPVPADSLIPMFESMVERAISRSANYDEPSSAEIEFPAPKAYSAASTGTCSKSSGQ